MSALPAGTLISSILVARNWRSASERRAKSGIVRRLSTDVATAGSSGGAHRTTHRVAGPRCRGGGQHVEEPVESSAEEDDMTDRLISCDDHMDLSQLPA